VFAAPFILFLLIRHHLNHRQRHLPDLICLLLQQLLLFLLLFVLIKKCFNLPSLSVCVCVA